MNGSHVACTKRLFLTASGKLSEWNAPAVVVDKADAGPMGECRITFNYRNVKEDLPGCYLELISKTNDYLSHPDHAMFLAFDLKHSH